jgi:site-specific DNA-methyltransferase (adenine-specific)
MEGMKRYPDKYFELAIVDPPYGIGANKEKPHNGWKDWGIKEWDNKPPNLVYFTQLQRVSKNMIIWGANHFIKEFPLDMQNSPCWLIWDKGQRNFSLADGEMAWTSFNTAMRIFSYSRASALQEGKIHPTQKPVKLYEWLLKNYAKEGDKILDTHGGSMSIAIACHNMGYDLTAFEIDKDYFEAGKKRLEEHQKQQRLFTG